MILYFAGNGRKIEETRVAKEIEEGKNTKVGALLSYADMKSMKSNDGNKRLKTLRDLKSRKTKKGG